MGESAVQGGAATPTELEAYRTEADRFIAELDEEHYLHYAGLKESFELEPIYARHEERTLDRARGRRRRRSPRAVAIRLRGAHRRIDARLRGGDREARVRPRGGGGRRDDSVPDAPLGARQRARPRAAAPARGRP